jgi:drug/metabolite transporter (DMT)-like permease
VRTWLPVAAESAAVDAKDSLVVVTVAAGYEIDIRRTAGVPLRLAVLGWPMSLTLACGIGGVLAATGVVISLLYTGSALATTAIGTVAFVAPAVGVAVLVVRSSPSDDVPERALTVPAGSPS